MGQKDHSNSEYRSSRTEPMSHVPMSNMPQIRDAHSMFDADHPAFAIGRGEGGSGYSCRSRRSVAAKSCILNCKVWCCFFNYKIKRLASLIRKQKFKQFQPERPWSITLEALNKRNQCSEVISENCVCNMKLWRDLVNAIFVVCLYGEFL
jgi:hypothetical protein